MMPVVATVTATLVAFLQLQPAAAAVTLDRRAARHQLLGDVPGSSAGPKPAVPHHVEGGWLQRHVKPSGLHRMTVQDLFVLTPGEVVATILIWGTLTTVCGYFFHKYRELPPVDPSLATEDERKKLSVWHVGVFGCMQDPRVCAMSVFCPAIRWSHTMSIVKVLSFWSAFAIFFGLSLANAFTAGSLFWIILSIVCAYYRTELKQKFGMETQGWKTYAEDCCLYCFCPCCLVAQEALHVRQAARCDHPAVDRHAGASAETPATSEK